MTLTSLLLACPDCVPGRAARAWAWRDALATHLVWAATPLLVTLLIVLVIHRILRRADAAAGSRRSPSHGS